MRFWSCVVGICCSVSSSALQIAFRQTRRNGCLGLIAGRVYSGLFLVVNCTKWLSDCDLQGPFALQDYQAWVASGHFVETMTVYHTSDTQSAYTLADLFSQAAPQPQPPLPDDPARLPAVKPSLGLHASHEGVPALSLSSSSSQQSQQQWRQDLAPKAKAIAEQLRLQLLESGKQAVYQLLKKSVHEALPGLLQQAREARAAEAAREAAEEEQRREEARLEAARAAAEAARLQAEAKAKARADAL